MKKLTFTSILVLLFIFSTAPVEATCYEVGMKVLDSSLNYVCIPIQVYERVGGTRIDDGSLYSLSYSGNGGNNFFIDYNDNCSGAAMISLEVGTEYVIEFHYPAATKSLCFVRNYCEGSYDTFYRVTPTSFTHLSGDGCSEEYSYPDCYVIYPLSVSLVIYDTVYIGDKIVFYLRATATGGNQSYYFTWSNASRTSPTAYTNPNTAKRTILSSQNVTVSVTVTSGGESVTKYKTLRAD